MFGHNKDLLTSPDNINSIDALLGRTVLSRSTANEIGHVLDLLADPATGELMGLAVKMPDESLRLVDYEDVYGFGPDALMIESDESAVPLQNSPLKASPGAKSDLIGVKVITETGKLLGQIANVYIHLAERSLFVYEIRSSILDRLLGHSLYIPGSWGHSFSAHAMRLVVSDEAAVNASHTLDELASHLFGSPRAEGPVVVVRSRAYEEPAKRKSA